MSAPLPFRGYAALFDVVNSWEDGRRLMVKAGAFSLAGASIPLLFGHDRSHAYASTRDGSLRVWQDNTGLAFEFEPMAAAHALSLAQGINSGAYERVSVCYPPSRSSRTAPVDGALVEIVTRSEEHTSELQYLMR